MPTLNIKNEHVYDLAKELSDRTGRSMTSVIEQALERELAEVQTSREGIADKLMEIARRTGPLLKDLPEDATADLYDEWGLPR